MFQNLILFKIFHSKTAFYPFFLHIKVFEKADNCRICGFAWSKVPKKTFCKQNIHQNLFFYKSNSLRNLIRCQTCLFEIWQILKFSMRNCPVVKKWLWVWRLWNSWFKTWRVGQKMFQKPNICKKFDRISFFWMKTFFSATIFPRIHKKANIDVFTVYIDQLNCSLWASFPKNLDFLTTLFSSKTDAL